MPNTQQVRGKVCKESLRLDFESSGLQDYELARKYGCSRQAIHHFAQTWGFQGRTKGIKSETAIRRRSLLAASALLRLESLQKFISSAMSHGLTATGVSGNPIVARIGNLRVWVRRGISVYKGGRAYIQVPYLNVPNVADVVAIDCLDGWSLIPYADVYPRRTLLAALNRPKISINYGAHRNKTDWYERYWENWEVFLAKENATPNMMQCIAAIDLHPMPLAELVFHEQNEYSLISPSKRKRRGLALR